MISFINIKHNSRLQSNEPFNNAAVLQRKYLMYHRCHHHHHHQHTINTISTWSYQYKRRITVLCVIVITNFTIFIIINDMIIITIANAIIIINDILSRLYHHVHINTNDSLPYYVLLSSLSPFLPFSSSSMLWSSLQPPTQSSSSTTFYQDHIIMFI